MPRDVGRYWVFAVPGSKTNGFWRKPFPIIYKPYELGNSLNCSVPVFPLFSFTFSF